MTNREILDRFIRMTNEQLNQPAYFYHEPADHEHILEPIRDILLDTESNQVWLVGNA